MRHKKGFHLFIMLAILIAHTLVLSFWLGEGEAVQKQASFKIEEQKESIRDLTTLKAKFNKYRDSISNVGTFSVDNFNTHIK